MLLNTMILILLRFSRTRLGRGLLASLPLFLAPSVLAGEALKPPPFAVGERETVLTKPRRDSLGLSWFMDGNLGVLVRGDRTQWYGANGTKPIRFTATTQRVEPVTIVTGHAEFQYLAGGPIYRDPESGRLFLFYHAEIHRGSARNFYSVLGLSVQVDKQGLRFRDLGPVFTANRSNTEATGSLELCGAPYVIKDGYFHLYGRDAFSNSRDKQNNLSVARARVEDVVQSALTGTQAQWKKYYRGAFSEPALGGKSSPLETGNPPTRWMDVSYNPALKKFILVVAANSSPARVELFIAFSEDGLRWTKRVRLANENGESFYPSIIGSEQNPRQTGTEFYVYYTHSKKGGWDRWSDAEIVRRRVSIRPGAARLSGQ